MSRYVYYLFNDHLPNITFASNQSLLHQEVVIEYDLADCFPALLNILDFWNTYANDYNSNSELDTWLLRQSYADKKKEALDQRLSQEDEDIQVAVQEALNQLEELNHQLAQIYLTLRQYGRLDGKKRVFIEEMRLLEILDFNLAKYMVLYETRGNLSFLQAIELAQLMMTQDAITIITTEATRNMKHLMERDQNHLMVQFRSLAQLHRVVHQQTKELTKEMVRIEIANAVKAVDSNSLVETPRLRIVA